MDQAAREEIALIRRLMEETRQEAVDRGRHLTIWGGMTAAGLLATWWRALGRPGADPVVAWLALLALGWALSLYVGWREEKTSRVRTAWGELLGATWVAAALTLTAVGVAGLLGEVVSPQALPGVISTVLAMPIYMTARLTGEPWLGGVAVAWWIGGGVMLVLPGLYALPLMAAMSLGLMVVPGAVLSARASRERPAGPGAAARDG